MMTIGRKTIEARGLVGTAEHETIRHRGMRMGLPHRLTQKHPRGALQLPFLPKAAESRFMTIGSKRIRSRGLARLSREPTSFTSPRAHELTSPRAHEPTSPRAHEPTSSRAHEPTSPRAHEPRWLVGSGASGLGGSRGFAPSAPRARGLGGSWAREPLRSSTVSSWSGEATRFMFSTISEVID